MTGTPDNKNDGKITEEELAKSLAALEGKQPEPQTPAPVEVQVAGLQKTASDTLKEKGSEELKKSLEVSATLTEFAALIGMHVDTSLEGLAKSVKAAAERDRAVISVLENLSKSVNSLKEQIEKFGQAPAAPASTTTVKPLLKNADGGKAETEVDPLKKSAETKRAVLAGLEILTKSAPMGSVQQVEYQNATIRFETTGQISDLHLKRAMGAVNQANAA